MARLTTEVSDFAPMEAQAFDGMACPPPWNYSPDGCVMWAIRKHEWDKLDSLLERDYVDNVRPGQVNTPYIRCKVCGLQANFDMLETSDTKFDTQTESYTDSSRAVLAKTGARRRIEEARAEMDRIASDFEMSAEAVREAHYLFTKFHEAGSSAGGRGHKTTVVAALHIASKRAHSTIPVRELCKSHSESPDKKVVNRFIKQARMQNLIDVVPPDAKAVLTKLLAKLNSTDDELNDLAKKYCEKSLVNVPARNQAASSVFLAAKELGKGRGKYSGVNIAKASFVERRQIYMYARRIQELLVKTPKTNPPEPLDMTSNDVQLLRKIRRG